MILGSFQFSRADLDRRNPWLRKAKDLKIARNGVGSFESLPLTAEMPPDRARRATTKIRMWGERVHVASLQDYVS